MTSPKQALPSIVVDASFVSAHYDQLVLCDVRFYLDGRDARQAYEGGHLPGAVFVDLDRDLASQPGGERGRHPFPSAEEFARRMGALGIAEDIPVVAYDDSGGGSACRLVWMLRSIGQPAAVLDGGLRTWTDELEQGAGAPRKQLRRHVRPWPKSVQVSAEEIAQLSASEILLDARAGERFRGETETIDSRAGHIPGARNLPWNVLLEPSTGAFLKPAELRQRLLVMGITSAESVTASCGSGVSACAVLVAMQHAGLGSGRLFVPSWSGWSASSRPIATGA